ncbi:pentatricopeptide repeat-containing protein At3g24000, mitochondrial [Vigna radiata var. radiata]|uniref:Pentatricopeptide repeat-containing protein At3g24000, mitochondrial n=1 Tax=Vigna radiata var. radiata TaxID=3916 RepID=A0A1S3TI83_VIGRR|nr:pentatricopeptide repeat-containing protein At3g24000, mitochondrial [Vigna radiata var. radiata]
MNTAKILALHCSFASVDYLLCGVPLRIRLSEQCRKLSTLAIAQTPLITQFQTCANENKPLSIGSHPNPQVSCFHQKGFSIITDFILGKALHAICVKGVLQLGTFHANTLINMYCKFGCLKHAQYVFDKMPETNEASWNNMMSGFVRVGWYNEAMRFFCQMLEHGVRPNSYVAASLVTACDRSGCMAEGALQAHALVVKCGLVSDVFVGTSLLHFYGTCGRVSEVDKLFQEIEEPNIVSWTALMVAYAYNGCLKDVLTVYQCLRHNGVYCNENAMATVIRSCGMLGDKKLGYQVLGSVIKSGLDITVSVANSLISMFGNFDSIEEASCVFDDMNERDTISWNSIITAIVHNGHCEESLEYFSQMRYTHTETDYITISAMLPVCGSAQNLRWGRGLHGIVVKSGLESNICVCNSLLSMYSQAGKSKDAELVFHRMSERDIISWNSMMANYVENGNYPRALQLLIEMLQTRKEKNYVTFTTALSACYNLEKLKMVHALVILLGLHPNLIIGNALVTMYGKFGSMAEAQQVCKIMHEKDEVTWNALIGGHADNKETNAAIEAFNLLRKEDVPVSYITIVNLLSACLSPDNLLEHGMPIHAHIVVAGFELDTFVQSSLITMYAQCGDLNTSNYIFDELANKNSSTWNAIVSANAHYGPGEEALKLIVKMRNDGIHLDQFSFSVALAIIGNLTLLDEGQQFHGLIIKHGFDTNDYVLNATMDMYGKCGEIDDVFRILPQPRSRSHRSWNILISALARHGFFQQARKAFHEMLDLGLRPDHVTFVSLLSACSHGGLVDEGLAYFSSMSTEFCVPIGIEHCVCIIDLLGRAGRLAEAESFINKMSVPPNDLVWRTLLASCKIHGNLELARKAAHRLFQLDLSDDSAYVLYSNVCASTRRWGDMENVRKRMESHNIKKKPACSWIKLKNQVTTFGMGDQYHPQNAQIYSKLEELKKIITEAGYVPDTSYSLQDTDEEQKEHNLWNHSERIALAFGLINSPEGSPLRIFKNLRVCGDCHSVFKMVSQTIGRKIILRDAYRFHHFSNGMCSCLDYW